MDFLDFVEEYNSNEQLRQFDKIKVIVSRAKDIYDGKPALVKGMEGRKPTAIAHYELSHELIETDIHPPEDTASEFDDFDEDMEEDE